MQIDIRETYEIGADLNRRCDLLERAVTRIVAELDAPPPRNAQRIEAICTEVSNEVRALIARFPAIPATQARVQARAEAQGRSIGATRVQMPGHWYDLNVQANLLRQSMNRWPEMRTLVLAQKDPPRRPLYPRTRPKDDPALAAAAAADRVAAQTHRLLNGAPQDDAARAHGCHDDIPLPASWFMQHALAARRVCLAQRLNRPLRFIDIGCGGGLKVLAALQTFDHATGLEFDPGFADSARAMLSRLDADAARIVTGDALDFDGYGDFDVLYVFRPMREAAALERLERKIVESARPGALIVAPYRGFLARHAALGCARVSGAVFAVGFSARAARSLRMAAERTGTALQRSKLALPGLWGPILAASFANGFAPPTDDWMDRI